jgi:hypothetical protein
MIMSKGKYVYIAKMDIPPEHEALFNNLYDNEHFPAFRKVPGVLDLERFVLVETKNEGLPKYAAIYNLESPDVIKSPEWRAAADTGEWAPKIRPHTYNRIHGLYRRI